MFDTEQGLPVFVRFAHMGKFSTDRTIKEYADEIWDLKSVPIEHA